MFLLKFQPKTAEEGSMQRTTAVCLILLLCSCLTGQARSRPTIEQLDSYRAELRPLLDAIRHVESGGNDDAVGDNGNALGPYQLWVSYWQDATEWCRELGGAYDNCRSRVYAERCMVAYWHRYCRKALTDGDHETLARVHNGGPKGAAKEATQKYWVKVSDRLDKKQGACLDTETETR